MLAEKYIDLFEKVTGEQFTIPEEADIESRMSKNLGSYMAS